jgi:hypothetical protein
MKASLPTIVAKRRSPRAARSLPIEPGEIVTNAREVGARHMACAALEANRRRNLYAMPCNLYGARFLRGQGELSVA